MALDAFVYCDCFEKDNLRCGPPLGAKITVAACGEVRCHSKDPSTWASFQKWKQSKACLHRGMILLHHRIGAAPVIDLLREELEKDARRFPMLLRNVLYSSTHTCDWIPIDRLEELSSEVRSIHINHHRPSAAADALQLFKIQMAELIIAAQSTGKPICF